MPQVDFDSQKFFHAEHCDAAYSYSCRVKFTWNNGVVQMPVAAAPVNSSVLSERVAAEVCQFEAPHGTLSYFWKVKRTGLPPRVPSPVPDDDNQILLTAEIDLLDPKIQADGNTREYSAEGFYVYVLRRPIWLLDNLKFPGSPADTLYPVPMTADRFDPALRSTNSHG